MYVRILLAFMLIEKRRDAVRNMHDIQERDITSVTCDAFARSWLTVFCLAGATLISSVPG